MPNYRQPDIRTEKFISKKTSGRVITSPRKFGLEFEFVGEPQNHNTLSTTIPSEWGVDFDSSINGARRGNDSGGVEYVSPVLAGYRGERAVRLFLEQANELNMGVDESCSLHLHLDAPEFTVTKDVEILEQGALNEDLLTKSKFVYSFSSSLLRKIRKDTKLEQDVIVSELVKRHRKKGEKSMKIRFTSNEKRYEYTMMVFQSGKYMRCCLDSDKKNTFVSIEQVEPLLRSIERQRDIIEREINRGVLTASRLERATLQQQSLRNQEEELIRSLNTFSAKSSPPPETETDLVLVKYRDLTFSPLKKLLMFYTAFSDVFLAMQPISRREGNRYCQRLDRAFSLYDIYTLNNKQELEAFWYKTTDQSFVESKKNGSKYESSRYYGLNLHRLFNKGTIEIRMHAGTTNQKSAIYWTALHQHIVDKIANGGLDEAHIRQASDKFDVYDKVITMMDLLELPETLRKYVEARVNYFKN